MEQKSGKSGKIGKKIKKIKKVLKCYWNVYWLVGYFARFNSPYRMDSNGTKFKLVRKANLIL